MVPLDPWHPHSTGNPSGHPAQRIIEGNVGFGSNNYPYKPCMLRHLHRVIWCICLFWASHIQTRDGATKLYIYPKKKALCICSLPVVSKNPWSHRRTRPVGRDQGICTARALGGHPGSEYWMNSVEVSILYMSTLGGNRHSMIARLAGICE